MKSKSLISQENIDKWPEILATVDVSRVPLEYISYMRVYFLNNRDTWEIDIAGQSKLYTFDEISVQVAEFLSTAKESIDHVDIEINIDKVKKVIDKITKKFFKKNKI